jgi:hypothetical protein
MQEKGTRKSERSTNKVRKRKVKENRSYINVKYMRKGQKLGQ